ncbi:hypothetical protein K8I28_07435 [bacterium]|nr:hypothetical protein [bacterium]
MAKILGVGRAVYDLVVVVPKYPEVDSKGNAIDRFRGTGSPVPNALSQLSLWGHDTSLVATIGNDYYGKLIKIELESTQVRSEHLKILADSETPTAHIWVEEKTGKRTIVLDRTIASLSPQDLPSDEIEQCDALLIDGWETEAAIEVAHEVRRNGGRVMLDAGAVRDRMETLLGLTDWIVVPVAFAKEFLKGQDLFEAVNNLRNFGSDLAIITNGAGGCVASWDDSTTWFPAFKTDTVDTTGAGDVFHAGIMHGMLNTWKMEQVIQFASAAAAIATTKLGGRGKLPIVQEIAKFLTNRKVDSSFCM